MGSILPGVRGPNSLDDNTRHHWTMRGEDLFSLIEHNIVKYQLLLSRISVDSEFMQGILVCFSLK